MESSKRWLKLLVAPFKANWILSGLVASVAEWGHAFILGAPLPDVFRGSKQGNIHLHLLAQGGLRGAQ